MFRSAACASPRRSPDLRCFASRMKGLLAFHRRCIHPEPRALDQTVLGQTLQHPAEDLVMTFQRQTRTGPRQPGMVRHALPAFQQQELAQAQAVRTTPLDPPLAVDPPRSSPPAACGSSAPAAATCDPGPPTNNAARRASRHGGRNRHHVGSPAAGRRTDDPATVAAPTSSTRARSAAPFADPMPCRPSLPSRCHRITIMPISSTRC
jgi:hypothetical protein